MATRRTSLLLAACLGGVGLGVVPAAAAPTRPQAPGSDRTYAIRVGKWTRSFTVYAPDPWPSGPLPLLLVYHGAESTAAATESGTDFDAAANARGVLVAYPQGYEETWNEGAGHTPAEQAGVDDVTFTAAAIASIESRYRVDRSLVGATGISNGALMVEDLGCHLSNELSLIAPVEGELPVSVSSTCAPPRPLSVLEFHGTADPSIPYGGGPFVGVGGGTTVLAAPASAARWARLDRCRKSPTTSGGGGPITVTAYSGCSEGVTVRLDTVQNGVHTWPPGEGARIIGALLSSKRS